MRIGMDVDAGEGRCLICFCFDSTRLLTELTSAESEVDFT